MKNKLKYEYIIFIILFILYIFCGLSGYGTDSDTYLMLKSGITFLKTFRYIPSRFQGALVPELIIGLSYKYYTSNFISIILSIVSLILFYKLLKPYFNNINRILIISMIGLTPYYIIASTSSHDYIYSIFFIMAGLYLMKYNYQYLFPFAFALAISSRLSNLFIVAIILITYCLSKKSSKALYLCSLTGILTMALYIPAYISSGYNLNFLEYAIGDWNFEGYLARFFYKNIQLCGLTAFILIIGIIFYIFIKNKSYILDDKRITILKICIIMLIIHEFLFLKVPLEISYLLPLIFIIFPVCVYFMNDNKVILVTLFLCIVSYNIFNPDILKINYRKDVKYQEAIGAKIGLSLKPGILINDLSYRKYAQENYKHLIGKYSNLIL